MAKSESTDAALAREAEALYGLPASEYTKARNARAKELRPDEPELAAVVAKLPKPSAAAAAVNRLARDEPSEIRALVQAGRRLREAQEAAVAGKSSADLQVALREHRDALERVQREARRLKLSPAVLERVVATVRAASVEPSFQPLLERGLLAEELEASGFSLDPGLVAAAPTRRKNAGPAAERKRQEATRARVKAARERLAEAKRAAAAAEQELGRAEREAERTAAAVAEAAQELEEAQAEQDG